MYSISSSIVLIAIGAILAFAVEFDIAGLNINTIGIILMIVGALGVVLSLTVWRAPRRATTIETVRERPRGEVVRERDREI